MKRVSRHSEGNGMARPKHSKKVSFCKEVNGSSLFQQVETVTTAGNETRTTTGSASQAISKDPLDPLSVVPQIKNGLAVLPLHNLLILVGMFYFGITENVDAVMSKSFVTSIPLHAIYNYIVAKNVKKKSKSKSKHENIPLLVASSILVSLVLALPMFFAIILLGAPVYNFLFKTALLSLHLSQLVFGPLVVLYSLDFEKFKKLFLIENIYYVIFSHNILSQVLLTLSGCWLGVLPIPLDWDRPWQQWPITLLVGAYVGGVVGGLVSISISFYRKA
ncbi:GPI11 [Candida oxycetoniae]|uniref:Glycosylphosphatidylinositol anchor biosynthesis protein 11 n=1 Tax=Candida oxycetoniae TaxID=497107 RepID=A0AAI9SYI9_9ASCO|nr:GPI11 [Candida oxycetoniae]KAI3405526.2 GPI11 [Candida oxycetoniae]